MALINPNINFSYNTEEAILFYQSVFGGEFAQIMRSKDMTSNEFPIPESEANKIMYITLPIDNNVLMSNDVSKSMGQVNENEYRSKISINTTSREEADNLFNGLSSSDAIEYPMSDSSCGFILACLEINMA